MHRATAILAFLPVLTPCTPRPPGATPLAEQDRQALAAEVTETLDSLTEAMNAKDTEGVLGFYAEGARLAYLGCTEFISGDAFRTLMGRVYSRDDGVTFEVETVQVQILGPTAAVALQRGSSSRGTALFWTRALERRDGRWIITLEHESWPDCPEPRAPHPFTTSVDSVGLLPEGMRD